MRFKEKKLGKEDFILDDNLIYNTERWLEKIGVYIEWIHLIG